MGCTDYTLDYENSDATLVDDVDDLETSLREILPSESHRKKVQNESTVPMPPVADATAAAVGKLWVGTMHYGNSVDFDSDLFADILLFSRFSTHTKHCCSFIQ